MSIATVRDVLELALLTVSVVGGSIAVVNFRRDVRRRKAEWLMSLFERFYEGPGYKRIRLLLDYQPEPDYGELREAVIGGVADESAELLVDYLNFFEFVGSLWQLGQLSFRDLCMLFEYYIRSLDRHEWLVEYTRNQGFESLVALRKEFAKVNQ